MDLFLLYTLKWKKLFVLNIFVATATVRPYLMRLDTFEDNQQSINNDLNTRRKKKLKK